MNQQGNPRGCLRVETGVYNNWYWEAGRLNEVGRGGRYMRKEGEDGDGGSGGDDGESERMMLV
jgi:hypothetical protein